MRMNENKVKEINESYNNNFIGKLNLRLDTGLDNVSVLKGNWEICKLDELSTIIEELTNLRNAIESETGIKF